MHECIEESEGLDAQTAHIFPLKAQSREMPSLWHFTHICHGNVGQLGFYIRLLEVCASSHIHNALVLCASGCCRANTIITAAPQKALERYIPALKTRYKAPAHAAIGSNPFGRWLDNFYMRSSKSHQERLRWCLPNGRPQTIQRRRIVAMEASTVSTVINTCHRTL